MSNSHPEWLPALVTLAEYSGDFSKYINAVYSVFEWDFIQTPCILLGLNVGVRRQPSYENKWFTFWHCISEGKVEEHRIPDLRRCERVCWIRPVIENEQEVVVQSWVQTKNRDQRAYLWFNEEYLIVLGVRKGYYLLITAYPTNWEHTRGKLRKERDSSPSLNG